MSTYKLLMACMKEIDNMLEDPGIREDLSTPEDFTESHLISVFEIHDMIDEIANAANLGLTIFDEHDRLRATVIREIRKCARKKLVAYAKAAASRSNESFAETF